MLWIILGLAALCLFVVGSAVYYYARNIATAHIFIVNYNLVFERMERARKLGVDLTAGKGSVAEALRRAIEVFTYRHPFSILAEDDVNHLVAVFSRHPDPLVVATLFQKADKRQDATPLKDHAWVTEVARRTAEQGG